MLENKKSRLELMIMLDLPKRFSVMSFLNNINYCIRMIEKYSRTIKDPVIGYINAKTQGTIEINHLILPRSLVKEKKRINPNFEYFTLEELLDRKKEIKEYRYAKY